MPDHKEDAYLGTMTAGRMLGVSRRTVQHYIEKGSLKSKRWTERGHHHIPRSEIERMIERAGKREGNGTSQ